MIKINNKRKGTAFETRLAQLLNTKGYWVHLLTQSAYGQPADLIAVKNNLAYLIDAKVCSKDCFLASRIENNQTASMTKWKLCGNGAGWFALELSDKEIYMISHENLKTYFLTHKKIDRKDIVTLGLKFESWAL